MGSRVKTLLNVIELIYSRLNTVESEIKRCNKQGKIQQLNHTKGHLNRKLLNYKDRFKTLVNGNICKIRYEYEDNYLIKNCEAILVNLTDEEIVDILSIYCKFNHYIFKRILEIQRIPTKLS